MDKALEKFKVRPVMSKNHRLELLEEEQRIERIYRKRAPEDFMCFVRGLTIASQTGPRVFENCMAGFQRTCFEDLAPSLDAVRQGIMPPTKRWWIERTKKAAKDSDLAAIMLWLIAFPIRPIYMQVGAADREQAGIVKERMQHLLHWNPWLNDHVEIVQNEVRSKKKMADGSHMAKLDIKSSDVAGAHGGTPDVLIINELSHIQKWEFAENLMDNADGVLQGLVIIATNAGFRGTKAEVWRDNAIKADDWKVHVWAQPAPWHSTATIEDARRRNPPSRFKRLWRGRWASGKGDALDEDDIERCFILKGPMLEPDERLIYLGGLDLGISHDHSGLMVVGIDERNRKIKTAWFKGWAPNENTGEVDLIEVKSTCLMVHKMFKLQGLWYDPHEAKLMAQELTRQGVYMREMTFQSSTNITKMAETFMSVVESGMLECYDDEDGRLRRDIGKFNIVEKPYGFKLEAVSDEFGHADVGTALVVCLPAAVQFLEDPVGLGPNDTLFDDEQGDLSEDEMKNASDEMRELIEGEDVPIEDAEVEGRVVKKKLKTPQAANKAISSFYANGKIGKEDDEVGLPKKRRVEIEEDEDTFDFDL